MDKTRNKIFAGCLALLLVMVAGYALFSQNLTINGTAKAQGDFSVTPTCQTGIPANLVESTKSMFGAYFGTYWVDENGYYEIRLESIGGLGANLCGKMLGELGAVYMGLNAASFSSFSTSSLH